MAGTFHKEERFFHRSRTLCPPCHHKRRIVKQTRLLIERLALGLFGIGCLCLSPGPGIGWLFLNLFVFQIALMLSIVPHELGHACVAGRLGWRVFRIYIGIGRTVFKTTLFGFQTEFRALPFEGKVLAAPRETNAFRAKLLVFILAGPAANVILLALSWAAMGGRWTGLGAVEQQILPVHMFFIANVVILFLNLLPVKLNSGLSSDGRRLWEALRAGPDRAAASHANGFCLESALCLEKKQFAEAQAWLEKGLALYPDNLQLLAALGLGLLHQRKFKDARETLLRILPRTDKERLFRALMLNNIAYTDALIGGPELLIEADRYSLEALAILSWHPAFKGTRGTVLLGLGKVDEAMPLLREAMQMHENPSNQAQNACWLAIAEARRGHPEAGRKYLAGARKLDPTCFLLEDAQTILDGAKPAVDSPAGRQADGNAGA
jgi:tetratricopeptide (TPR) repeat protein